MRSSGPIGARESARMQATYTRLSAPVRAHIRLTPAFRRGQRALIILCMSLQYLWKSFSIHALSHHSIRFNTLRRFPNSYQLLLSSAFSSQGCRHNESPHTYMPAYLRWALTYMPAYPHVYAYVSCLKRIFDYYSACYKHLSSPIITIINSQLTCYLCGVVKALIMVDVWYIISYNFWPLYRFKSCHSPNGMITLLISRWSHAIKCVPFLS